MTRIHPALRLYRGPFSGEWSAVRVDDKGEITDKWPLHPEDQDHLNEAFPKPAPAESPATSGAETTPQS